MSELLQVHLKVWLQFASENWIVPISTKSGIIIILGWREKKICSRRKSRPSARGNNTAVLVDNYSWLVVWYFTIQSRKFLSHALHLWPLSRIEGPLSSPTYCDKESRFCLFVFCCCFFSRIFQRKISANRLAMVGMAGGRAASTIRLKFWLKFCFLTITQMFLNGIDWYLEH